MNGGQNHISFGGAPAGRKKALICACNYKYGWRAYVLSACL